MKKLAPQQALNKAFLKVKPTRAEIERFKTALVSLLDHLNPAESEEFHKNLLADFLKQTYYAPAHFINTKGHADLVIHAGKDAASAVGVIIEAKRPANAAEMPKPDQLDSKALRELVLYYLRERIAGKNLELRHVIVTNALEWFLFDAAVFEKAFAQNAPLVTHFTEFEAGRLSGTTTDFFYEELAKPAIAARLDDLTFTHFDLRDYDAALRNSSAADDAALIALFKLLSPEHLLKLPFANDSNTLDKGFYAELLHIIGLAETKDGSKKVIRRNAAGERHAAALIENAIARLESQDKLSNLTNPDQFGETLEERLFNVALELTITWMNRVLFLKLLEAQLLAYHKGDPAQAFLNSARVKNFDALEELFFDVLARQPEERAPQVKQAFASVPYLNSSLFEPTELEKATLNISSLNKNYALPLHSATVLKDSNGKRRAGSLPTLEYLFAFLDAYDFASDGGEAIQEDNKSLINASVLGLIFEKINGYKDGSFFTPGFITMYMCRETLRRAVVQKFNERKGWQCAGFDELYDNIEDRAEANEIVNSLKICDPAVGSGHFLVSALNELIAIKSDLRILQDRQGQRLKEYHVEVVNDELIVTDDDGDLFEYRPASMESRRVQEALFHEKQTIIERCLFGVDINPNSVKICRLRLWIELLKHAYYKADGALETLPNIDINIKEGNSLISRSALTANVKGALSKDGLTIEQYQQAVQTYREARSKAQKREVEQLIAKITRSFRIEIGNNDPNIKQLEKLRAELLTLQDQNGLFAETAKEKKAREQRQIRLAAEINAIQLAIEEMKNSKVYNKAFEWRFEFPEVLNENGDFVGFDAVIGNPPYVQLQQMKAESPCFERQRFETFSRTGDIYELFYEKGWQILKKNGLLCFISSNKWMRAAYGEKLRGFLAQKTQPLQLIDFGKVQNFEQANVDTNILLFTKQLPQTPALAVTIGDDFTDNDLNLYISQKRTIFDNFSQETWVIADSSIQRLKQKIEQRGTPIKELNLRIYFGIKTGFNEAFILDGKTKDELIRQDVKNAAILKPMLRGRDIQKWRPAFADYWVITTFPSIKLNVDDYPVIKNHLLSFGKERLEQSGNAGSRKKTGNKWFETQDQIGYWQEIEKPKILWADIMRISKSNPHDIPRFAYDESNYYPEATVFMMTGAHLKYVLALLNSKLLFYVFVKFYAGTMFDTEGIRYKKAFLEHLPIPQISETEQQPFEALVDQILAAKQRDPAADTRALEAEIDRLVYALYGLTPEEIEIVEGTSK